MQSAKYFEANPPIDLNFLTKGGGGCALLSYPNRWLSPLIRRFHLNPASCRTYLSNYASGSEVCVIIIVSALTHDTKPSISFVSILSFNNLKLVCVPCGYSRKLLRKWICGRAFIA